MHIMSKTRKTKKSQVTLTLAGGGDRCIGLISGDLIGGSAPRLYLIKVVKSDIPEDWITGNGFGWLIAIFAHDNLSAVDRKGGTDGG